MDKFTSIFKEDTNPEVIECLRKTLDESLFTAVCHNKSIKTISELLEIGGDPNYVYDQIHSPCDNMLLRAIKNNNYDLAKLLLKYGYKPSAGDACNYVEYGNVELLELLKEYIIDYIMDLNNRYPGYECSQGGYLLFYAGVGNKIDNINWLIDNYHTNADDITQALNLNEKKGHMYRMHPVSVNYLQNI